MSPLNSLAKTILTAAVLLLTAGCSVAVPESRAPELGALRVADGSPAGSTAAPALNRAEQLLQKVNVQPWQKDMPVVVQSGNKDMQCSISADAAACHLLSDVVPRPVDVRGYCEGDSQYHGGYAVVTVDAGARYGLCGDGISPMEAENMAGPEFPGPWLQDGEAVRVGSMVCERTPGAVTCAHLRTGHGFLISVDNYELW
ncbi:hypothetical protein [Arthrobacter sp.]|uniref:hypothetical protein n=1 Tax=Arthrobacter sp. TaxID=1667 RepID=UPI002811853D|nr:hypothetical protein [Arthrobacter sp.]